MKLPLPPYGARTRLTSTCCSRPVTRTRKRTAATVHAVARIQSSLDEMEVLGQRRVCKGAEKWDGHHPRP